MNNCETARNKAGHTALRLLHEHGVEVASDYYRGCFEAFALCLVTMIGREATYQLFVDVLGEIRPERSKPRLIVDNEAQQV